MDIFLLLDGEVMLEPDWLGKPESETEPVNEYDLDDYRYNQSKDSE
jgi:hypothetical protein